MSTTLIWTSGENCLRRRPSRLLAVSKLESDGQGEGLHLEELTKSSMCSLVKTIFPIPVPIRSGGGRFSAALLGPKACLLESTEQRVESFRKREWVCAACVSSSKLHRVGEGRFQGPADGGRDEVVSDRDGELLAEARLGIVLAYVDALTGRLAQHDDKGVKKKPVV